ncbi:MAG: DUF4382 domain-containing protein [bacterium]|nr:DUF4382 domain-containing protein [bacterium]
MSCSGAEKLLGRGASLLVALFMLAGCGGGGDSPLPRGVVSVAVTDAPSADFDNVWVTIHAIRFHTTDAAGPDEAGWLTFQLPAPVTVNLASLSNGVLSTVFSGLSLPVGHYQQIRLVLDGAFDPLTASASANSLSWNDQVDYTVSSVQHHAPLEIVRSDKGIALHGHFHVTQSTPLRLAVDFNIGDDIVKFMHGTSTAFTLKPLLTYFDLDNAGAISGQIDTSGLYPANARGGYNLVIKAEDLSPAGSRHYVVRATTIDAGGNFRLYPLPIPAGQSARSFDVVMRGRNMETIIVKNVSVTRSSDGTANAAVLQSTPVAVTAGSEFTANLSPAASPTGAWVNFCQTINGESVPYEIRYRHLNPFTGTFLEDMPLSTGNLHTGLWNGGNSISFTSAAPVEGAGNFSAVNSAPLYVSSAMPLMQGSSPVTVNFGALGVNTALVSSDAISGSVTQGITGKYDNGYLVVSRDGLITTSVNLATTLAQNGGSGGGYSINALPGGSVANPVPGMIYYLYAVVWNTANPLLSYKVIPVMTLADLRQGSAAAINLTLN